MNNIKMTIMNTNSQKIYNIYILLAIISMIIVPHFIGYNLILMTLFTLLYVVSRFFTQKYMKAQTSGKAFIFLLITFFCLKNMAMRPDNLIENLIHHEDILRSSIMLLQMIILNIFVIAYVLDMKFSIKELGLKATSNQWIKKGLLSIGTLIMCYILYKLENVTLDKSVLSFKVITLVFLGQNLLPAFVEEFMGRGAIFTASVKLTQKWQRKYLSILTVVGLNALIFILSHNGAHLTDPSWLLQAASISAWGCLCRYCDNSIAYSTILHAVSNTVVGLSHF